MQIAFITSSWPSIRCPWAGHFIADLAAAIAAQGVDVRVVAPLYAHEGALEGRDGVHVESARVGAARRSLPQSPALWPRVLWALSRSARSVNPDLWMAHWWPCLLALPRSARAMVVLHGSDVDLLERLPPSVGRWVGRRAAVAVVAEGLALRYAKRTGAPLPIICPLGAQAKADKSVAPRIAQSWLCSGGPKILTVARPIRGKGLDVARRSALSLKGINWFVAGDPPVHPREVRALMACADLCVVPSRTGSGVPSEGRPHIITQAMVAGVPCVGGPNLAVRHAMREHGQLECFSSTATALGQAVDEALCPPTYERLRSRALVAGQELTWSAVTHTWLGAVDDALSGNSS